MSAHLVNRWATVFGWAVLMLIVWALFVPGRVSVTTFVLLGVTGFLVAVAGTALWVSSRPSPSIGQILGAADSDRSTATALPPAERSARQS